MGDVDGKSLPEGEYETVVSITTADGTPISEYKDWFVKKEVSVDGEKVRRRGRAGPLCTSRWT